MQGFVVAIVLSSVEASIVELLVAMDVVLEGVDYGREGLT